MFNCLILGSVFGVPLNWLNLVGKSGKKKIMEINWTKSCLLDLQIGCAFSVNGQRVRATAGSQSTAVTTTTTRAM